MKFYNSLTHKQDEFVPIASNKVGLYTCGPTVYNYAHIGNFRAYIFEDLLKRALRYCGMNVYHVMNLTDVDDKTIRDSRKAELSLETFTKKYKDAFVEDVDTLRIDHADVFPAATEHIAEMIDMIQKLFDKGIAYKADDGCVYFSIAKFPGYGKLARIQQDQLRPGVRVKHDEYAKESVADFALWKAYNEDDGDVWWESPWGRGRPGWHIECSAMSGKYLGPTFDIHCGGIDNIFPHHEDEIAQSEAVNDCKFVNYWLHCAHLIVDGEKMSKSVGNFHTLRDLLERGYNSREIRWVLLGTHYRQSLNFSFKSCNDAQAALKRIDDVVVRLQEAAKQPDTGLEETRERINRADAEFRAGLEDDLNISASLAALFDLVREVNKIIDANQLGGTTAQLVLDQLRKFDTVLMVFDMDKQEEIPAEIIALAEERQAARKARDFARADAIRDQFNELGWVLEDTPAGPRIKKN